MKNIVLIGMPGCGKTTIGKNLAEVLHLGFIDVDEFIETKNNEKITNMFEKYGEEYFRDKEKKAIEMVSQYNNKVISTGGGVIKHSINMANLKETGIIIFINRPVERIIEDIDTSGRPLLAENKEKIYKLYSERYDLYKKYADYEIVNDKTLEKTIEKIEEIIKNNQH
ncbi:shikimate kinase [Clostridium sp. DL1XJH146]